MLFDKDEWFRTWFDSPFYALLYRNRSEQEAADFIDRLIGLPEFHDVYSALDLACGRGRHSVHLHQKGMKVTGIDLSNNSIAYARQFEREGLKFLRDDMRTFDLGKRFGAIFNLFTSFGYFSNLEENKAVLRNVRKHLLPEGLFVLDYFNAEKVESDFVPFEEKWMDEVKFEIRKEIREGQIVKTITVDSENRSMQFEERVQLIYPEQFRSMLAGFDFRIVRTFGNYLLEDFETGQSERFILIASL